MLAAGVVLWTGSPLTPRFLLLQNRHHGAWGFAKGHLQAGEDIFRGALREVEEETGLQLQVSDLDPSFADTSIYRPEGKDWKRVIYFLSRTPLVTEDLQLSPEHQDHAWLEEQDAVARLAPSDLRRTLIRAAARLADDTEEQLDD